MCPHPPLLVPELAAGAAGELDELRAACADAIDGLAVADRLVVVGSAATTREYVPDAGGSLAPYGADLTVGGGQEPALPLSLTIGRWLLGRAPDAFQAVAADEPARRCRDLGRSLAAGDRLALLVMGDGGARRGEKAPGYVDARARPYDAAVARAFETADCDALASLDPAEAAELLVAGRAAWQVLAGAADGAGLTGRLLAAQAPYGVCYLVAAWS